MIPIRKLVWVDLETTGLDPAKDVILEVGCIVTDGLLRELGAYAGVVKPDNIDDLRMCPYVFDMHTKSGLLSFLPGGCRLALLDQVISSAIRQHDATGGPMAGSSPHFDRRFIERDMPLTAACFNDHRSFDVTTLKQAWCNVNNLPTDAGDPAHRVLDDIRDSICAAKAVFADLTRGAL